MNTSRISPQEKRFDWKRFSSRHQHQHAMNETWLAVKNTLSGFICFGLFVGLPGVYLMFYSPGNNVASATRSISTPTITRPTPLGNTVSTLPPTPTFVTRTRKYELVLRGYRLGQSELTNAMRQKGYYFLSQIIQRFLYPKRPQRLVRTSFLWAYGTADKVRFSHPYRCLVRRKYLKVAQKLFSNGILLKMPDDCNQFLAFARALQIYRIAIHKLQLPMEKLQISWLHDRDNGGGKHRFSRVVVKVDWEEVVSDTTKK